MFVKITLFKNIYSSPRKKRKLQKLLLLHLSELLIIGEVLLKNFINTQVDTILSLFNILISGVIFGIYKNILKMKSSILNDCIFLVEIFSFRLSMKN